MRIIILRNAIKIHSRGFNLLHINLALHYFKLLTRLFFNTHASIIYARNKKTRNSGIYFIRSPFFVTTKNVKTN